ncbi:MAG: hypothetical protein JWQ83_2199 [Lacunisphaera sp.]|nr:hypothetical protein [Lacunisphaera sp.]MDB6167059.1 hypothetical protein [Lacunisphaera sp.]
MSSPLPSDFRLQESGLLLVILALGVLLITVLRQKAGVAAA